MGIVRKLKDFRKLKSRRGTTPSVGILVSYMQVEMGILSFTEEHCNWAEFSGEMDIGDFGYVGISISRFRSDFINHLNLLNWSWCGINCFQLFPLSRKTSFPLKIPQLQPSILRTDPISSLRGTVILGISPQAVGCTAESRTFQPSAYELQEAFRCVK